MSEGDAVESFPEETIFDLYVSPDERGNYPSDKFFDAAIPNRVDLKSLQEAFQNLTPLQLTIITLGRSQVPESMITPEIESIWNYLDDPSKAIGIIGLDMIHMPIQMRITNYELEWNGLSLSLHCVVEQSYLTFRVGLTLFDKTTGNAIAFRDLEGRYYENELSQNNSYGHRGPARDIVRKGLILGKNSIDGVDIYKKSGIPEFDLGIRQRAMDDSFYVFPENRGNGFGGLLWITSLELSRRLGAHIHHVAYDESRKGNHKESYYANFLDTTLSGGNHSWVFPLTQAAADKVTQFQIKNKR